MGINVILPLIIGIGLMLSLGTTIAPSIIEDMKIAKIENKTIDNQEIIKNAITRYIQIEGKIPKDVAELKAFGLLRDYHESNLFDGGYSFKINKEKGTLKIFTTINDKGAGKYFSNSFESPNKPNCVELIGETCKDNLWETFYLLDEETFSSLPPPEVGSTEWADKNYTIDNLGKKLEEGKELENGYVDYVKEGDKIIEYIYDKTKDQWLKGDEIVFEEGKYLPGSIVDTETLEALKYRKEFPLVYEVLLAKKKPGFSGCFGDNCSYYIWYRDAPYNEFNNFWKQAMPIIYNKYHNISPTLNQSYTNSAYDTLKFSPNFEYVGGVGCDLSEFDQHQLKMNQFLCLIKKVFNVE